LDNILTISDLNLSFVSERNKEDSLYLFRNLELNVPAEKISSLVGGNGAGKTTLFNVICGIQKGAKGKISFKGKKINGMTTHRIARSGIGRLFQSARVFEEMSILDNMIIGARNAAMERPFVHLFAPSKVSQSEQKLTQQAEKILVELFGESNPFLQKLNEPASNLSFGQQRLLALAKLLMGDYSLYLLDEPTAGVHASFLEPIAETIRHMNSIRKKTVLLIEHNMQFVRKHTEYCMFMAEGKIIKVGSPGEVLDSEIVQKTYMGF
jgi:ABC-type branched-subunit amino acid transport system ATPase component